MNHLAHVLLAGSDPPCLIGNVAGDFIKGPLQRQVLMPGVLAGVQQHRRVDAFTDTHPILQQLKGGFEPRFRRYGGIIMDLAFDHYLCKHWHRFVAMPRRAFMDRVYVTLQQHESLLPAVLAARAPLMIAHDWLDLCASMDGVELALRAVGRRLQRDNPLAEGAALIEQHQRSLEAGFLAFFPELRRCAGRELAEDWLIS